MENKLLFVIVLFGCILLFLGIIVTIILLLMEKKEDWRDYDSYILSITWSPSTCFNKKINQTECFNELDKLNINSSFIIHGLWPVYSSGENIDYCNKDEEIKVKFNKENETILSKRWPGLNTTNYDLWNHEYNKHGYCYIQRLRRNTDKDYNLYFDKANDLFIFNHLNETFEIILPDTPKGLHIIEKSKFTNFLESSGLNIIPSSYSLRCTNDNKNNTMILNEIWFNYDIHLKNTTQIKLSDNCPDYFYIYFRNENKIPVYEKYDFYVLTVIWPNTYCLEQGKECYIKLKKRKERNILTVHGLWPSYLKGGIPQWCNLGKNVEINNYTEDMEKYWINIYKKDNKDFWNHEYNKHGYCYNQRNNFSTDNYTYYFDKTMYFYNDLNLKDFMNNFYRGILGGMNKLNKTYLSEKMHVIMGNGSFIICCKEINGLYYLDEIRIKFDINFIPTARGMTGVACPEVFYAEFLDVEGPQKQAEDFDKIYDMYFFTILWLGTTCHQKGYYCYNRIEDETKNKFTIHGLWPNLRNGTLPDWCNGKNDIEIYIEDKSLRNFMQKYYISGYHSDSYFWGHEYNKHGYCYNQRNNFDVNKYELYFQKTKEIYTENNFANLFIDFFKKEKIEIKKGDMAVNRTKFEIFFKERGFPNDTYLIVCTNITEGDNVEFNPHLLEIRIRYDLNFNLLKNETDKSEFDCPEIFYAQFLADQN